MQEKNEALLKAENGISIEQLQERLEMTAYMMPYCCRFIDDWYKDIVAAGQEFAYKMES